MKNPNLLTASKIPLKKPVKQPQIISSIYGPIKHVLFSYPYYEATDSTYRNIFGDLFVKLPSYTRFTIWSHNHPRVLNDLKTLLETAGIVYACREGRQHILHVEEVERCVILLNNDDRYSVWAQDPFVVVEEADETANTQRYLLEPEVFFNMSVNINAALSDSVAARTSLKTFKAPLFFHGGNILVGDDFILMGRDSFKKTLQRTTQEYYPEQEKVLQQLFTKQLFQYYFDPTRAIEEIGSTVYKKYIPKHGAILPTLSPKTAPVTRGADQPLEHIDLFLSLAGRTETGQRIALVAIPISLSPQDYSYNFYRAQVYDRIADELRKKDYLVIRNPMPRIVDTSGKHPVQYYAYYNNCLVEIDLIANTKRVWLPTYGHGNFWYLKRYDEENADIWQSLGFEVNYLTDYNPLSRHYGGVHCITKYLER